MTSNSEERACQNEIGKTLAKHLARRVEDLGSNDSASLYVPSRELTPWPEDECALEGKTEPEKIMEEEKKSGVEEITIPVEATKLSPIPELDTPGSSVVPEISATASSDNNIISSTDSNPEVNSVQDTSPSTPQTKFTKISVASLVCAFTASQDLDPPISLPTGTAIHEQKMDQKDPLKRKRKNPSAGNPKPKKIKVAAELKKAPACKSCYHKHIGCERPTENDPCRACERRKQPCERNDVRVVKGEKTVVKDELNVDEPLLVAQMSEPESTAGGSIEEIAPSAKLAIMARTDAAEEDGNSCELNMEEEATTGTCNQKQGMTGSQHSKKMIQESEVEENATGCESVELAEAEKEAADILMGMRCAKVELLDIQTCNCYFEAIKSTLAESTADPGRREAGLAMLDKLQWQLTWLSGYENGSRASDPFYPCD
ncbi:hypothetical protein TWF281_011597 [Arthrobotrys megalospora]